MRTKRQTEDAYAQCRCKREPLCTLTALLPVVVRRLLLVVPRSVLSRQHVAILSSPWLTQKCEEVHASKNRTAMPLYQQHRTMRAQQHLQLRVPTGQPGTQRHENLAVAEVAVVVARLSGQPLNPAEDPVGPRRSGRPLKQTTRKWTRPSPKRQRPRSPGDRLGSLNPRWRMRKKRKRDPPLPSSQTGIQCHLAGQQA